MMRNTYITFFFIVGFLQFSPLHASQRFPTLQKYYVGDIEYLHTGSDRPTRELRFSDMNGDTIEDLFVINSKDSSYFSVLYGNGDGTFDARAEIIHSGMGVPGRVNYLLLDGTYDGLDDVLQSIDHWDYDYMLNFNSGTTTWYGYDMLWDEQIALHYLIGVCDCDHDGRDDFIGQNRGPESLDILIFRDEFLIHHYILQRRIPHICPTNLYPLGDYNGDGWTDFLVSCGMEFSMLFEYQGSDSCNFSLNQNYHFTGGFWRVERGDFNGDGIDDLVYNGEWNSFYYVVFGSAGGLDFSNPRQYQWLRESGWEVAAGYMAVGDINGDGLDDVCIADRRYYDTEHILPVLFYFSDGDTFLADCDTLILPSDRSSDIYSSDLNGDGYADLCYFPTTDTIGVLINAGPTATLLRDFEARFAENRGVVLSWEVIDSEDCDWFTVMRDAGKGNVEFSCRIDAERERCNYTYIDTNALALSGSTLRYHLKVTEKDGSIRLLASETVTIPAFPLRLHQNFPNPFNPCTVIRFDMPAAECVRLDIFDVSGRLVRHLVDGEEHGPGPVELFWDGTSDAGKRLASGVYYCRLRAGKETRVRKMVLLQ